MAPSTEPRPASVGALEATKQVLRRLAAEIARTVPGAIDGSDPEDLHDLRVALRRTRSVLRELRHVVPDEVASTYGPAFAALARATGEARDLDVYLLDWDGHLDGVSAADRQALGPVRAELEVRRADARAGLRRELDSVAVRSRLDAWSAWLSEAPEPEPGAPLEVVVCARLERLHKRVLRDGRRITPTSPAAELHELRKDAKRLRYLVDCFPEVFAPKARAAYLDQLRALQDNLGEHQDAEVQVGQLRGLARQLNDGSPEGTAIVLAIGHLIDLAEARRAAARAAFAKRFRAFDGLTTRSLLAALLR